MALGKYVVFDGMDGSGKGTQIKLLQEWFGDQVVFTREPGGTDLAEKIRDLLFDKRLGGSSTPLNNFLLFWAAREDLLQHLVAPMLGDGKNVFSDRGYSSTYAYQLHGEEQRDLHEVFFILKPLMFNREGRRRPDLHIVYDLPAEVARERVMRDAERDRNHFDDRPLAYYERVREGFRRFSYKDEKVRFVDATQTPKQMHEATLAILRENGIE